jgi:hypothetical protein
MKSCSFSIQIYATVYTARALGIARTFARKRRRELTSLRR